MSGDRPFTLLLVDDNPTNLLLLAKIIEMDLPQVRVLKARSAREGLLLAEQERIDGAFIDVQMPQVSGLDMCRELRKRPHTATIPLVLITAHLAAPEMRAEGLEVGAYDFISQPISNVEMLARVKVMLRMIEDDRRVNRDQLQLKQQLSERADHLRWISGLLISGDGALAGQDDEILRTLWQKMADVSAFDEQLLFEKIAMDLPRPWRRTLIKLALLDSVPMSLARELSEISDIRAVVDYLSRHDVLLLDTGSGTEKLVFKGATRDFLRSRADHYLTAAEQQQVLLSAVEWYRGEKDYGGVVSCLVAAGRFDDVALLFSQLGLNTTTQWFRQELLPLIAVIPDDVLVTNGWLALGKARCLLCDFGEDTPVWLELAYQRFESDHDQRGMLLAMVLQVVQAIYVDGSFEPWRERLTFFKDLYSENAGALLVAERFKVMFALGLLEIFVRGDLVAAELLAVEGLAEAQQQKHSEAQVEFIILRIMIALWQGRLRVASAFLEQGLKLAPELNDPLLDISLEILGCELLHARGDEQGFERQYRGILARLGPGFLDRSILDTVLAYLQGMLMLARQNFRDVQDLLEIALSNVKVAGFGHQKSRLLQLRGCLNAMLGNAAAAREDLAAGLRLREVAGGPLILQENRLLAGITCYHLADYRQAESFLKEALAGHGEGEDRVRAGVHAWLAATWLKLGKKAQAADQFGLLLDALRRHHNTYFWGLTGDLLVTLLPLVKSSDDESLLRPLFEKYRHSTLAADLRPVPLLYVRCLGVFELELEGRVFNMGDVAQASRQIFAMLLAAPGQALSIETIMTTLWPDRAPAKARNSFDTAHSRLRKTLEAAFDDRIRKEYLVLEKGLLTLKHTRVDSAAFCQMIERVHYHLQRENYWQAEHACRNMDPLWKGRFLNGFELADDLAYQSDRLVQVRLEQLRSLTRLLLRRGCYDEAMLLLQQCLALDPTQDSIVRQLLLLYRQQRDYRAATALQEQYRKALLAEDYEPEEVDELLDALDGRWSTMTEQ